MMKDKKEFIRYIFWGIVTTLFNLGLFWLLNVVGLKYKIANLIAIISTKILAYVCNKLFVYKTKCANRKELIREIISFIISRLFTFFVDFIGLIILVDVLHINKMIGKVLVLGIVVIINYILGKKFVYKKTRTE